jgi:hypothetical protein
MVGKRIEEYGRKVEGRNKRSDRVPQYKTAAQLMSQPQVAMSDVRGSFKS